MCVGWGADVLFECTGNEKACESMINYMCPGGCIVLVGMPQGPIKLDVVAAQVVIGYITSTHRHKSRLCQVLFLPIEH